MPELCLTLLCPPAVEEKLLDLLLMAPHAAVFTSSAVAAHGMAFGRLSQTEQVLGQARAIQVQVLCSAENKSALLDEITRQFSGAGLRYWVTLVNEMGEIA